METSIFQGMIIKGLGFLDEKDPKETQTGRKTFPSLDQKKTNTKFKIGRKVILISSPR
jgi:hypothetical protein